MPTTVTSHLANQSRSLTSPALVALNCRIS